MTKFVIGVAEIKKVVSQLEPIFKGNFEDFPKVLFQVEEKVTVYATNGESYVKIIFECDILEKGNFIISGEKFADIVKSASGEKIEVSTTEDNRLSILAGNIKYRIALVDTNSEYLMAPVSNEMKSFTINAQDLKTAISCVTCCIDQGKPHLNCVLIHSNEGENNRVYIVATDYMRLGVVEKKANITTQIPNLLLPKKAADYIVSTIGEIQEDVEIKFSENTIQVSTGNIFYTSKLFDTSFPKYQSVIPDNEKNNKILEVKTKEFKEIIEKITKVSDNIYDIKLILSSDKIKITCIDGNDSASAEFEATFSDTAEMEIVCKYRLLKDILEKINSSIVRIQISDNVSPMLIRPVDDDSVKYIFMPVVES